MSPPKVLFVVGMARSGSTLLSALLNRVEGWSGLGEIHLYWELVDSGRRCGCGRDLDECPVWGALRHEHKQAGVDFDENCRSFHAYVRPRPRSLLRGLRARRGGGTDAARLARYAESMRDLYGQLAARTGAEVIVDSTKLPTAADLTAGMPGVETYVVHLVRDPRAVAHSLARRRKARSRIGAVGSLLYLAEALRAAIDWTLRNAYVEAKLRRSCGDRYTRIRFEDLTRSPGAVLAALLAFTGTERLNDGFLDDRTVEFGENHILTGDESRFRRGRVAVTPQDTWQAAMPVPARLATSLVGMPLLRLYGYPLLPRSDGR